MDVHCLRSRRRLLRAGASVVLVRSFAALAQQPTRTYRVSTLAFGSPTSSGPLIDAFKQGMQALGYVEGPGITYDMQWGMGDPSRLGILASQIVSRQPDAIFATSDQVVHALQQATDAIPIVSPVLGDVIRQGFAESWARPGKNITGFSNLGADLSPKLLEFLLVIIPRARRIGVLWNPGSPNIVALEGLREASKLAGVDLARIDVTTPSEIERAFASLSDQAINGMIVSGDALFFVNRRTLVENANRFAMPTVFHEPDFAEAGGLLSYGARLAGSFKRCAVYVDKILKGAKPADLPIERWRDVKLVINLGAAKAINVSIPQSLLQRADEVIP